MRQRVVFVIFLVALVAFATSAMGGSGRNCSFAGTWYGGSDGAKYLMTIVPKGGNSYSITFEGAYTLGGYGVAANTTFSGEMEKIGPNLYEARIIALVSYQSEPPPTDPNLLEIDAGRSFLEKTGCNEVTSTLDYFVGYFGWGAEPFVDEPDIDFLAGGTLLETYHRISMAPID